MRRIFGGKRNEDFRICLLISCSGILLLITGKFIRWKLLFFVNKQGRDSRRGREEKGTEEVVISFSLANQIAHFVEIVNHMTF